MDEIKKVALEVADENGRNFVLDSSGITAVGVPVILYSDPKWDITDEVLEKINADAPEEE